MDTKVKKLTFLAHQDERGGLVAIEAEKDFPFTVKRFFYVYGCEPSAIRGLHANRYSQFVMICLHGSVCIRVHDGKNQSEFLLDKPDIGLYMKAMTWKEMYDFSEDAVLLILSSTVYDPDEYIRNFDEFIKEVASNE